MSEVTCIGILVADLIGGPLVAFPSTGKLVSVDNMGLYNGGCATNTGIALARQGIDTQVFGMVGSDGLGDFLVNTLKKEGINTQGIKRSTDKNTSATMVILNENGERSYIHHTGANGEFGIDYIDFELLNNTKIAHIAGSFLMSRFDGHETAKTLKKLRSMRIITSLDTAWDFTGQWLSLIEECLPYIDIFIPSIDEAQMISGKEKPEDIAEFFMSYGIKTLVLKMGGMGSFAKDSKETIYMPPFNVDVKDTTGAGDAFVGGFLAGISRGMDLKESLILGNALGAMCVMSYGASSGIKSWEDTMCFIKENNIDINQN
jgi:sugar/nucleoside kinase (ribokinase family)